MVTTTAAAAPSAPADQLMEQLGRVCEQRGLPNLAVRLLDFQRWIRDDLRHVEGEIDALDGGSRMVQHAAKHLLDLGGKHLRPMCVILAARAGGAFTAAAHELAVAVEFVHTATLLHDDVVDMSDRRRGAPTARCIYGNAASVFAGDWLLIQALQRVRRSGVDGALDRLLSAIDEMVLAESLQLEQRGAVCSKISTYLEVVEGKTAALFRWAMWSGAAAGGLDIETCTALEHYGLELGVAFQIVDDYLDFAGDSQATGKNLFADLREGKMTYPMLLAMDRDPALAPMLEEFIGDSGGADAVLAPATAAAIAASLERTGALADSRAYALERVSRGIAALDVLPSSRAKDALIAIAEATTHREK